MRRLILRISVPLLAALSLFGSGSACLAQALSPSKDEVIYRVKPGDSLIGLGERFFVSPTAYLTVQRVNGIENANALRVGSTIVIPVSVLRTGRLEARVIAFKGQSSVTARSQPTPVDLRTKVSEGALLETGIDGFLTLELTNGSKISLPSNSRLRIVRMRTYLLTGGSDLDFLVERGRTETSATHLPDNRSRFRMRTPVAVSAVRGTVFRIGYDGPGSATLTEVVEGNVVVQLDGRAAQTSLPTGFGAAGRPGAGLQKEELLPPPVFAAPGAAQRGRSVQIALAASTEAVGYHVQVAQDRDFLNIVAEGRSPQPMIELPDLPPGRYYARATAIAPSGLEGMPGIDTFERRLQSLTAQRSPGSPRSWRFDWDVGGDARDLYTFQVFADGERSLPIIDEPALTVQSMMVSGLPKGRYTWRIGRILAGGGDREIQWTPFETFEIDK